MSRYLFLIIFVLTVLISGAQPKYEFRAVWVATVANIDWPSKPGLDTETQKAEAIRILDMHKDLGMNAVILQIRPSGDAFYRSEIEPWSRYLEGTQGQAPNPYYDPLEFWISECHARGMELHAWLNPYRITQKVNEELSANHIVFQHPEWVLEYGNKLYFDPGIPAVRSFIAEVVKDIVKRYDVDAIHMDDYFYPYPTKEAFPDTASFQLYSRGFLAENIGDWRRENVDITIKMLNETIKSVKPWVKFGISPFGVWRNKADDPRGSETKAGTSNYDGLYANIIKWQEEGWIDYSLPQLYWHIGMPAADFEVLAHWWSNHTYGRALYIGQAPYRIDPGSNTPEWTEPDQLPKQLRMIHSIPEIGGSAYFSSKSFNKNLLGFQDSLRLDFYKHPAIIPPMPWLDAMPPKAITKLKRSGRKVMWSVAEASAELDKPWQFVVYRNEVGKSFDPENSQNMFIITKDKEIKFDRINRKKKKYEVRISVLDRLNNESRLSVPVTVKM
ncbi:family 10 glycosylhydrolase [Maribellus sp. YY47]|uniref:glycoside hydrolase family 10 protein n=1 Tax=Maribellus sp. YY47 TaxID=2929486 RepID=UPI002000C5A0|nr:family 10 glycosylhydrolase [Maribellus sp. YY47]MCK3683540.1 family 10 glycosylhydrolase [Maribellus sp. YY47]